MTAPRGPGDDPADLLPSGPSGNGPDAVPATLKPPVLAIRMNVGIVPAGTDARDRPLTVSRSRSRDDPASWPGHPSGTREAGGKAGRSCLLADPYL